MITQQPQVCSGTTSNRSKSLWCEEEQSDIPRGGTVSEHPRMCSEVNIQIIVLFIWSVIILKTYAHVQIHA